MRVVLGQYEGVDNAPALPLAAGCLVAAAKADPQLAGVDYAIEFARAPIEDAAARAREIIAHHRDRLDRVAETLTREPQSGYQVSRGVFGEELDPTRRRFAVAETLSHLERLIREGRAARVGTDRSVTYTAA